MGRVAKTRSQNQQQPWKTSKYPHSSPAALLTASKPEIPIASSVLPFFEVRMPRAKRPLAVGDPNASKTVNVKRAKRASPKTDTGVGQYRLKSKDELVAILREQDLPHTGTKEKLLLRLEQSWEGDLGNGNPAIETVPLTSQRRRSVRHIPSNTALGGSNIIQERDRDIGTHLVGREETPGSATSNAFDYTTKDNSKLRTLLSDRGLSVYGTREEMILRLTEFPADYDKYSVAEITEILRRRGLKMAGQGSKEIKIKRLMLNDELDHDTENVEERNLYVELWVQTNFIHDWGPGQLGDIGKKYSYWNTDRIKKLLKERKLSCKGDKYILMERLRDNDRRTITMKLEKSKGEYDSLKTGLESRIGHLLSLESLRDGLSEGRGRDTAIQMTHQPIRKGPVCDYNWKDSHWASRSERQLREICTRREMPGDGPKAARLKWLDTGELEYNDLYRDSLVQICRERGLRVKSGDTRGDLANTLTEADETEEGG